MTIRFTIITETKPMIGHVISNHKTMSINELNGLANDILVMRLTIADLEKQKSELTKDLDEQIETAKQVKTDSQKELLELMSSNELKSWKTEKANFARAARYTASIDPIYKKQIEKKLKDGEQVENWELKKTEFISIRTNNK